MPDIVVDTNEPPPAPEEPAEETPEELPEVSTNIVERMYKKKNGKLRLKEIAKECIENYEEAWDNNQGYRDRIAADWKLFSGDLKKKSWPYKDAANVHVPILLENVTRIAFRAYAELFGDWDDVFGVAPLGPDDEEIAKLLTLHGNWQIRNQIPDFRRQMMRGMLAYFVTGDTVFYSWWDELREQNRHELVTVDEFVVPYVTSTMPDFSDVPFRVRILNKYKADLIRTEGWIDVDKVLEMEPSQDDEPEKTLKRATKEVFDVEETEKAAPYRFLQYEGWFELNPDSPAAAKKGDLHFYRVIVDLRTRRVMEITLLEEPDWQDKLRYQSQMEERQSYLSQVDAFNQTLATQQQMMSQVQETADQMQMHMAPEQTQNIQDNLDQAAQIHAQAQPPVRPSWMMTDDALPKPLKMVPVHMFTHMVNIEPPDGSLGLGQGRILADFNRAANTAASQFTDAATLANCWSVILADGVQFDKPFEISPGGVNKATGATGQNIRESIIELKPGPANPQLMELVQLMDTKGQAAMQAPSVLSGEAGKSGEPYRGLLARIEQATKQLSVPTRRFADGLEQILKNNAKLNAQFLKDEEIFHVAEGRGLIPQQLKVGRAMYERNYHVEIRADLRFTAQTQKTQEADELLALYRSVPQLENNFCLLYHILKMCLQSRDQDALVQCLGPQPPYPPTLAGFPPPPQQALGAPPPGRPMGPQGVPGVQAPPNIPQPMSKLPGVA